MTILLVILGLIIVYLGIYVTMNIPGCTGTCAQGTFTCDCPLGKRKDKRDI
jgi:hypothetical protein